MGLRKAQAFCHAKRRLHSGYACWGRSAGGASDANPSAASSFSAASVAVAFGPMACVSHRTAMCNRLPWVVTPTAARVLSRNRRHAPHPRDSQISCRIPFAMHSLFGGSRAVVQIFVAVLIGMGTQVGGYYHCCHGIYKPLRSIQRFVQVFVDASLDAGSLLDALSRKGNEKKKLLPMDGISGRYDAAHRATCGAISGPSSAGAIGITVANRWTRNEAGPGCDS